MYDHILPGDTQAILLLCGHFSGKAERDVKPLTLTEYNDLAGGLRKAGLRPENLLHLEGREQIADFGFDGVDPERLTGLLGRGVEMGFAVEAWTRQGIWVVSRGETSYPARLKSRLREEAPALLFGVGNRELLDCIGLAVVGSRNADERGLAFARDVATRCAEEGIVVVSGGARGVDDEAMQAALSAGGSAVGVLPESVSKLAVSKAYRSHIQQQRLVLLSPYHPAARWTSGNAMGRNKHIYALSDWSLVVSSEAEGGTWSGAVENLKRGWVPLFVRTGRNAPAGNEKLIQLGGIPFPDQFEGGEPALRSRLDALATAAHTDGDAPTLFSGVEGDRGRSR